MAAGLNASPWARIIKASDFTDNGIGLIDATDPQISYLARKYAGLAPILRAMISRSDTPLDDPVRRRILEQLDLAKDQFYAILSSSQT